MIFQILFGMSVLIILFNLIFMQTKKATIVTIGDEILIGQITDTNAQFIAQHLTATGFLVKDMKSISDQPSAIIKTLDDFFKDDTAVLMMTGGLGPTKDDLTKNTLATYFDDNLVLDVATLEHIKNLFEKRGLPFNKLNEQQAHLPASCKVLPNANGTAAGMWFERENKVVVSLPGVPFEMKPLLEKKVIPLLQNTFNCAIFVQKTVTVLGIGESALAAQIAPWEHFLEKDSIKLAYLPSAGRVRLRLSAWGKYTNTLEKNIAKHLIKLNDFLSGDVVLIDAENIAATVQKILVVKGQTLSVAESCTGGLLACMLTEKAGASRFFKGGITAYSVDAKINFLNVSSHTIKKYGVVSQPVAKAMADGVKKRLQTDYALSITGNAGPTVEKGAAILGTVCIALATPEKTFVFEKNFGTPRKAVLQRATHYALEILYKYVK